jgi:hypothetical protein
MGSSIGLQKVGFSNPANTSEQIGGLEFEAAKWTLAKRELDDRAFLHAHPWSVEYRVTTYY